jgi:hypothetical protein
MLKELNPLLHSQLRLAVMSILLSVDEADFVYLKEQTNASMAVMTQHTSCNMNNDVIILLLP